MANKPAVKKSAKRAVKKPTKTRRPYRTLGGDLANAILRLQTDMCVLSQRFNDLESTFFVPQNFNLCESFFEEGDVIDIPPQDEGYGTFTEAHAGCDEQVGGEVL